MARCMVFHRILQRNFSEFVGFKSEVTCACTVCIFTYCLLLLSAFFDTELSKASVDLRKMITVELSYCIPKIPRVASLRCFCAH